jgi:ubiquinone/menaquinone biosynthesis C-methylase UbiE
MDDAALSAQIAGARAYDALFVSVADRCFMRRSSPARRRSRQADRVLDVACGTGVLTGEAASRAERRWDTSSGST